MHTSLLLITQALVLTSGEEEKKKERRSVISTKNCNVFLNFLVVNLRRL